MFELFGDPMRAHEAYLRVQTIHPFHEEVGKALDRLGPDVKGKSL